MSKALRVVAVVAGVVAVVATGGAALAGAGTILGVSGATLTTVATIASTVSAVASVGAQLLAKPPPAKGNVTNIILQSDAPQPYAIGRTYAGGVIRHDVAYGGRVKKVDNPYRAMVIVYSGSGPIEEFESLQVDFAAQPFAAGAATGYFSEFMFADQRVGNVPESAHIPRFSGMPGWSSEHKLSGYASVLWNFKFDKDGKKYASGIPQLGAIVRGVRVYDPRLDSTYPGGVGSHRIENEATWTYSENPALHALTYAFGRYTAGKLGFGIGLDMSSIDVASFVAWANVCDDNLWTASGLIFEPSDKWQNLKWIMEAGGALPVFSGGLLSVWYQAPRIALDTITIDDLADGSISVPATKSFGERINTIVAKWRSEDHQWQYIPTEALTAAEYVTADGEVKTEERQFSLVANGDQAAQLAGYDLTQRREIEPIEIVCKPRMRLYGPGDCLNVDIGQVGLTAQKCVILSRTIDPRTLNVSFVLATETDAKHAFALGLEGAIPPLPGLNFSDDFDLVAGTVNGGISTTRFPDTPLVEPAEGSLYYDELLQAFRFEGRALTFVEDPLLFVEDPIENSGYVSVQDKTLSEIVQRLQSIDDDGLLTVDEKIRILIPESSRLEAEYQGILAQSVAVGVGIPALTDARAAWLLLRNGLVPAWDDVTQDSAIVRSDWDSILSAYRDALSAGKNLVNGVGAVTVVPPATQLIRLDQFGIPITGELPRTIAPIVKRGANVITLDDDVSYSISASAGITATVENTAGDPDKGDITITAGSDGFVDLTVTVADVAIGPYRIAITDKVEGGSIRIIDDTATYFEMQFETADGETISWQRGSGTVAANDTFTVNFPQPFASVPKAFATGGDADTAREGDVVHYAVTATSISIKNSTAVICVYTWDALGKI